jgi:DNA-binding PadR family transcriptional regulator
VNEYQLLILAILNRHQEGMHFKEISLESNGKLNSANFYALAIGLEQQGLASSKFEDGGFPRRRLYWITETGRQLIVD